MLGCLQDVCQGEGISDDGSEHDGSDVGDEMNVAGSDARGQKNADDTGEVIHYRFYNVISFSR